MSNFLRQENDGLIDTIAQGRQALLHSVLGSMPVDASEGAEKVGRARARAALARSRLR